MYAFDFRRPHSLNEADLALKAMPGAKFLAGGQTLIPTLKQRLAKPSALIDLSGIAELKTIEKTRDGLTIGATATHFTVANNADVKTALPGLAALAEGIGDPQVRHRGTIGGSLANNDPAADYPAALLALDGTVQTNKRTISAEHFFKGYFATDLSEDEVITAVLFPTAKRFAYAKFPNPASRYALVGVAVAEVASGIRVAVTGAGADGVFRVPAFETALAKSFTATSLVGVSSGAKSLVSDRNADAEYREHLIGVMARRAVRMAGG